MAEGAKGTLNEFLEDHSVDLPMLDAVSAWAENPTSKSAGYGVDENYQYIRDTLATRYPEHDVDATVERLQEQMATLTELYGGSIYDLRQDIKTLVESLDLDRQLRTNAIERIQQANENQQYACLLIATLLDSTFQDFSGDMRMQLSHRHISQFSTYHQALFQRPEPDTQVFVSLGLLDKLLWISSGTSGSETKYIVPRYLKPVVESIDQYVDVDPPTPTVQPCIDEIFAGDYFEPFEHLLFQEDGIASGNDLNLPFQTDVVANHADSFVISPFVVDRLKTAYRERRVEQVREDDALQTVLDRLRDGLDTIETRHQPRSEVSPFVFNPDTVSYQGQITVANTTTPVILTNHLSYLSSQQDFSRSSLLILVNQRMPAAERQLERLGTPPSTILIYGDELYGLTPLQDTVKEIVSELLIRGYTVQNIEIERGSQSTDQTSFHDEIDKCLNNELWRELVLIAGSDIENRIHQIYKANSTLSDPDAHKAFIDEHGSMDKFGLGLWIGYFRETRLFDKLDERYDGERDYFRVDSLSTVNSLYVDVKHDNYTPSPAEARETAALAKNIMDETTQYPK